MSAPRPVCLLTVVLMLAGCSGLDIELDHRVSTPAPVPLVDEAPPLGSFVPAWQTNLDGQPSTFRLVGGHLVAVDDDGLAAYDARTGAAAWHYREPGREVDAVVPVGSTVVVSTYQPEHDDERDVDLITEEHLVSLDAGTGEVLWENTDDWELNTEDSAGGASLGEPAEADIVVVEPDGPFTRAGADPRTGEELWRVHSEDVAEACTEQVTDCAVDAEGALVVVDISCGLPNNVVAALEADSGELRWRRPLPSMGGARITLRNGATLIDVSQSPPLVVGPDGADLFVGAAGTSCRCELSVAGDQLVLQYLDSEVDEVVVIVDPGSGAARTIEGWPQTYEELLTAGGQILGVTSDAVGLVLPTMLASADVTTGEIALVPWLTRTPAQARVIWSTIADGRLLSVRQSYAEDGVTAAGPPVLVAFEATETGEPLELSGVGPDEWPDACALVANLPVSEAEDHDDSLPSGDPAVVGGQTIPVATCSAGIGDGDGEYVTLSVRWVGATPDQAAAVMAPGHPGFAVPGADDLEWWSEDDVLMRVGRVVVGVSMDTTPARAKAALTEIARQLRALDTAG